MNIIRVIIKSLKYVMVFSLLFSCSVFPGCAKQSEKFTKVVNMPAEAMSAGLSFQAKTQNGSIVVHGSDATDCNVTATITAYASKVAEAQEAVEQTKLYFERSDKELVLKISPLENIRNRSVSVNLDITLPNKTNMNLESHNGNVTISNIEGSTTVITYNGNVSAKNVSGITKLQTHNGQIDARQISGDINFLSYNGSMNAIFEKPIASSCNISMETYNGSIDLTPPLNYSARANIFTYNGSININLPVTVTGKHNRNSLIGIIRDDKNELRLQTHNGAIVIR